jgi:hypothetical protein
VSRGHPGVFWTHDDGDVSVLYAVDSTGALLGRFHLVGAGLLDWEDLALSECGSGDCLYYADSGNNDETSETLRLFRIPEPEPRGDTLVSEVGAVSYRLPHGGRDIEAVFVLPGERVYFISKGRNHPVTVYRAPGPLSEEVLTRPGEPATVVDLEEVQRLSEGPRSTPRQITGASASPDGETVAVRTYETVTFYRVVGDTLTSAPSGTLNLRTLREPQGEGVGLGPDGIVALTSEAGPLGRSGSLALVRCQL